MVINWYFEKTPPTHSPSARLILIFMVKLIHETEGEGDVQQLLAAATNDSLQGQIRV